jgi:hypothetical protein
MEIELSKVSGSSQINAVGYHPEKEVLLVEFQGGQRYLYLRVPKSVYDEFMTAESKGKYLSSVIKNNPDKYPFCQVPSVREMSP